MRVEFRDHRIGLNNFLRIAGRDEKEGEDFSTERLGDIHETPLWCCDVPKFLAERGRSFKCRRYCGVSTPEALLYAAYPPELVILNEKHGGFLLTRTGLFVKTDDFMGGTIKICPPIWVEECHSGILNGFGARTVVLYDIDGNRKSLTIDERDLDSPKLFALLRSHRFECPTGKTEKGLLREFLLQQYPKRSKPDVSVAVDYSGWNEGEFVFPRYNSAKESYKLKSKILPSEPQDYLPHTDFISNIRWQNDEYLAAMFSLAAPLFKLIGYKGLCLHFHGVDEQKRDSILRAVNFVWSGVLVPMVCSVEDASKHVVALKQCHKDLPLCIREVPASKAGNSKMRTFLRRYFLGRKGADVGVRGVIISTGDQPLTPEGERNKGRNGYGYAKRVLLVDIPIGGVDFCGRYPFDSLEHASAVERIKFDGDKLLQNVKNAVSVFDDKCTNKKTSLVNREIVRFFALIYSVHSYLLHEEKYDAISSQGYLETRISSSYSKYIDELNFETKFFASQVGDLHRFCGDVRKNEIAFSAVALIQSRYIIITANIFKKMWGKSGPSGTLLSWLKREKILKNFKNSSVCGVHHFPGREKSVRSYKVNLKRLDDVSCLHNKSESFFKDSVNSAAQSVF